MTVVVQLWQQVAAPGGDGSIAVWRSFDRTGAGVSAVVGAHVDTTAATRPAGFNADGCFFVDNGTGAKVKGVSLRFLDRATGTVWDAATVSIPKGRTVITAAQFAAATAGSPSGPYTTPTQYDLVPVFDAGDVAPPPPPPPAPTGPTPPAVKSFPSAAGFGASAVGGRGPDPAGTVPQLHVVSSLDDAGPGTLRAACESPGPRFAVFAVAGNIELRTPIVIRDPYLTIAGHTAPHGGVCVRAAEGMTKSLFVVESHDLVVRYLRVRQGFVGDQYPNPTPGSAGESARAVWHGVGAARIVYDHCSFMWATDEIFTTDKDAHDITVQWSVIAEPLHNAGHNKGGHGRPMNFSFAEDEVGPDTHKNITVHHCLIGHGEERLPQISTGAGKVEVINCVVYGAQNHAGQINTYPNDQVTSPRNRFIGNYFAEVNPSQGAIRFYRPQAGPDTAVYVLDNIGPGRPTGTEPEVDCVRAEDRHLAQSTDPTFGGYFPWPEHPVDIEPAAGLVAGMLSADAPKVGATLPLVDEVDARVIASVRDDTGATLIDHPGQTVDPVSYTRDAGFAVLTAGGSPEAWQPPGDPMGVADNGRLHIENALDELAGETP